MTMTLPNQKAKEVADPTLHWIFQTMLSISVAHYPEKFRKR